MLTKSDLRQIETTVETTARKIIKQETKDLATNDNLSALTTKDDLKRELKPIKSDIAKIRKDVDVIISMFDREYVELRKRVERLEEHLNLPPLASQS